MDALYQGLLYVLPFLAAAALLFGIAYLVGAFLYEDEPHRDARERNQAYRR
jgi:hypothetical protein